VIQNRSGPRSILEQLPSPRPAGPAAPALPAAGPRPPPGPAARWAPGAPPAALLAQRAATALREGAPLAAVRPLLEVLLTAGAAPAPGAAAAPARPRPPAPAGAEAPAAPPDPADLADLALLRAALDAPPAEGPAPADLAPVLDRVAARRGGARVDGRELGGLPGPAGGGGARWGVAGVVAVAVVLWGAWLALG